MEIKTVLTEEIVNSIAKYIIKTNAIIADVEGREISAFLTEEIRNLDLLGKEVCSKVPELNEKLPFRF